MANFLFLFPRTNYLRNWYSYSVAVAWKNLPVELRQANCLNLHRKARFPLKHFAAAGQKILGKKTVVSCSFNRS